jgi:hypothetical protein
MTTIKLSFKIPVYIASENLYMKDFIRYKTKNNTKKYITHIINNIKSNSRLDSQDNIISNDYGVITLRDINIDCNCNGINILTVTIVADVEHNCDLSIEAAEDIIWAILPASYSDEGSDLFRFDIDGKCGNKTHILFITDIPSNITIENY